MNDIELKLKLLSGEPLKVDNDAGYIKPLTIRDIAREGYNKYLRALNMMTIETKDLIGDDPQIKELGLNVFDLLVQFGGDDIKQELNSSFEMFFQDKAEIYTQANFAVIGESDSDAVRIINRDNFDKMREVVKWQNCINKFGEDDLYNPEGESEEARRIKEKLKKGRETVQKIKREDDEGKSLEITDIISAVSTRSNSINKLNVFDLNMFQLYDEFKRLEMIDQYDLSIKSMLSGAKNVKISHWSSKID